MMAKRLMKKPKTKSMVQRLLALTMILSLVMGLLPTAAFAQEPSGKVEYQKDEWTFSKDEKVAHKKTIEKTGENQFEITLQVKTMEEIQKQAISPDAAVVLVMDVSNSMKETVDGKEPDRESDQRIYKAKAAAKNFIDSFAADAEGAQRKVALVEFGSSAYTVQGWTDAATAKSAVDNVGINFRYPACTIQGEHTHDVNTIEWSGFFGLQWRCNVKGCDYYKEDAWGGLGWFTLLNRGYEGHTHEQTFNGPHGDELTDGGGTNIEGGLQLADNLLSSSAIDGIGNCYVVLITDGVPTYHVYQNRDNSSLTFIEGQSGGGSYAKPADYENVPNVANSIKDQATLYTVSYASDRVKDTVGGQKIDAWLASFANKNIKAGDDIDWGLGQVSQIIQNQSKAWILTDPIPAENFITFSFEDNANIPDLAKNPDAVFGYDSAKGELVWNLRGDTIKNSETAGNVTWYIYEAKYTVRLNTAAKGFVEDQPYETNGTTTLSYMLTENGQLQPDLKYTDLVVPKVSGKTPMVDYTINYLYKDKESGEYKVGKTDSDSAKMWSKITIDSGAYSKENYRFKKGPTGEQTLTTDGLVFNLYYDPIPANVVVNHWVSTVDQTDDGDVYNTPVLRDTDSYPNLYMGDKFTNEEFLDSSVYTQVESVKVGDTTYTTDDYTNITLPEGPTVINIYYTAKGDDERTPVDYEIHYWYREDSWQLNADGKYEKVTGTYAEDTNALIQQEDYHGVTITAPDKAGEYTLDGEKTTATYMVLDKDGENRLDIYYYKDAPAEPPVGEATLTIKHVYKQETINGVVVVEGDNWTERENETVYVGETYAATPDTKGGYTLKTLPRDFTVTINEAGKHYEIVVEYYKDVREPVDIVMNHYYTTYTWTVDPITGEGDWDEGVQTKKLEGVQATGTWYAGQTYTPSQIPDGYTYVSGGDARELTSGTNIFDLYYETYVGSEADQADVTVNHIYTTYRSYVDANGNVVLNEPSSKTESEDTYYGMKGDTFTAEKQEKDGFTFVKADTDDLLVTLQGEDGQYNLYYEKSVNELGAPYTVTVQPIYKTYTTSVNAEGQVVTTLTNDEDGTPVQLSGNFYEGQKVTALAADYGKDGFAYAPADEENTKDLTITVSAADGNVIYVVYSKTDNQLGLPVVVMVNNVYTTVTKYIDANGELQTKESSVTGSSTTYGSYYVGQFFDTTGKSTQREGYALDTREGITQPADSVKIEQDGQLITFYWLQEVDETVPATVKVVHHYTLKDANPNVGESSWDVGDDSEPLTGYFAGQFYQAGYDFQNGTFAEENVTDVVPTGAAATPGIKLVAGLNEIHIYYEKSVDTRVSTTVRVIHNYYADAEALAAGTTEATYEENPTKMEADTYTAALRTENNGLFYTFSSADPADYTITVDKDASKNVITISYVRAETGYTVNHVYRTNGSETGSVQTTASGKVGDVINAADIAKETVYQGNTYTYTGASADSITLVLDAASNSITLYYDRTTGGGGGGSSTYYDVTVNYVDQDTGDQIAPSYTDAIRSGRSYDVSDYDAIAIEGYTYVETTGDALTGYMTGDKVINVYYTAEETNLDDGDVPMGELPDDPGTGETQDPGVDIEDPDVPMAEAPETGDSLMAWVAAAGVSGVALVWLAITGKKRKEEEGEC